MINSQYKHTTVLLDEAVDALFHDPSGIYVDGTFGRGGHSRQLLSRIADTGRLIAFDKDPDAVKEGERLASTQPNFTMVYGSFSQMAEQLHGLGIENVDGVLLDLGVSSPQLDDASRGFSFMSDGPLDMRMDCNTGETAAQWLGRASVEEIGKVLKEYGEERFARRIAQAIVDIRTKQKLTTTRELASLIEKSVPFREKGKHPATRSFQAIRIFINKELDDLIAVLEQSVQLLRKNGRLVVISFHSLEDRIVKRFIQLKEKGEQLPRHLPIQEHQLNRILRSVGKPVRATQQEVDENVRARSAIMRVAVKL